MAVSFSQTFDQFEQVKKAAIDAVNTVFPVQGKLRKVTVDKVWVDDKLDPTDYKSQASARMRDSTWGVGVYAHLKLHERGKIVDEQDVKLFTLPKPTQRHSYIVGGKEYQVQNQLRLKPGVYTLRKQNGELKTQVNLARGKNFDLGFDEAKGLFTIQKIGGGQANIPLFPILQHLGIGRAEIAKAWGERITSSNQQYSDPKAIEKIESAFKLKKDETLKSYLETKTQIDPQTTKAALGHSFEKVDGFLLLQAAKQLLDVHMGRQEPTDRDSLEYKSLLGIDDFIKERLEKNKTTLSYKVKRNIDSPKKNKLSQIVGTGAFNSVIEGFFTQDDKANFVEQTNPLEMITGTQKVTIMGAGGIGSTHAITPEMRQVHSSHFGLIDPVHTPESDRTGVNLHLPTGAVKDGNDLKTTVVDKQGKTHYLSPVDMKKKVVAFPGQKGPRVKAMKNGQTVEVDISQVDYFIPSPTNMFSWSTNLIPFLPSAQGNRAMMAAKMMEQAISLKNREAPLVQSKSPDGRTMENIIGEQASVRSPVDGTVAKITADQVIIKPASGPQVAVNLYKNFLLNGKSFLNNEVTVKVGDKVTKGQLLADSNYTKGGTIALGTNLKTAYIPYKGYNFDDGIVISEAASKKLTSEHLYKKEMPLNQNISTRLDAYKSHYPNAIEPTNLNKLDADGVIKKGEKIKYGEAYIVGLQQRSATADVSLMSRMLSNRPKDISMVWTNEDVGTVIDVIKSPKKITVIIKTEEAAKIGDKLAGRHGNKGVITKIIPDSEMPQSKSGQAVDMLLNPLGITSRINISQIYESAAGKAAQAAGKPVEVSNFTEGNYLKKTKEILKKHGIDDEEELIDPATGKSLGSVHVGIPHILKLYKQTSVNYSARQGGPGHGYDANLQPLKAGGEEGAKSLDMLTMYSMLSHGARHNLREMASIKGSKNDEFWKALKAGEQLPPPPTPFVFDKFLSYLKGAGIDVKKEGTKMTLAPLTDEQVMSLSSGEITKPLFFRSKDMQPIKGGFFDPVKTGGFKGSRWGHMDLAEPVVNPPFENAVKKLTGLGKKYEEVVSGKMFIANDGTFNTEGKGLTGARAIESLLKNIDVKAEIRALEEKAKRTKGSSLDDINKRLRYLTSLDKLGLRPEDAYIRKTLPVVPPNIRPVYPLPDGNITSSDVNYLYRNVGIYNTLMKSPVMDLLAEEDKSEFRKDFHTTVKAVSGLTDVNIAGKPRDGFIGEIKGGTGGQPKEGLFQRKIISKQQDYVGRGTIIPEPSLGVDEMAMPEPMAWKLFEPFVIKELRNHGLNPNAAMDEIKRKTPLSKKALEIVMKDRHVLLNRAPSLHKYSVMAFKPKITDGKSIKIPPLVNKGFNADHDGDTMTIHVPITNEANNEAARMTPSQNLFQPGSGKIMIAPDQEAQVGIYYLSKDPQGRKTLEKILGPGYTIDKPLDKGTTAGILTRIAKEKPSNEYSRIVSDLKAAGEKKSYEMGFSVGLRDLPDFSKERKSILDAAKQMISSGKDIIHVNKDISDRINRVMDDKLKDKDNPLYDMVISGAKGKKDQIRSLMITPLFVADAKNNIVKNPIGSSYIEGLDAGDYWTSMSGARKGMMDRAVSTMLPGSFSKDIMATTIDNIISMVDCGTEDGVILPITSNDLLDRFTAGEQAGITKNSLIDTNLINKLKAQKVSSIKVRSPLKCRAPKGTCAHCYGLDEHNHLPEVGENIGAKSGQTIAEPLIQMTMNSFHSGGVAGTGAQAGGLERVQQLLQLPKTLVGSAALAPVDGTVTKIVKGLAGGFDVYIGDRKVHVSKGRNVIVKVGMRVEKGDTLSDGPVKPQDLAELKGVEAAQNYLTDALQGEYKAQGIGVSRKTFETVVRSLTNTTQVTNNPKHADYLPGDILPYTVVNDYNSKLKTSVDIDEAVGYRLAKQYGSLMPGKEITDSDVRIMKSLGMKTVEVEKEPIEHKPFVKGVLNLPLTKGDWMASLGYRNLSKVLTEGAAQGWQTDIENYHPIPPLAHATTFGKGKEGKY